MKKEAYVFAGLKHRISIERVFREELQISLQSDVTLRMYLHPAVIGEEQMNNRDRTMAVFTRGRADRLLWQPRLHYWYDMNRARGKLPKKYEGLGIIEIYDDLGASPRGYHYFNDTIRCIEGAGVQLLRKEDERYIYSEYRTPKGNLREIAGKTEYGTASMRVEYFLKTIEDFEVLTYILKHQSFEFDKDLYEERDRLLGNRSEPIITVPHGSIQRLSIEYMGFQKAVVALWKHREEVERLLQAFDEYDDGRFRLIKETPFKIVNFGDNIDEGLCPPTLFERYMLPYYQRRTKELHDAGKFCTSHWDGRIKSVLPYAGKTGLDGLECVPPEPQGNITLDELKEGLNRMILVDGIPATHFLPLVGYEQLRTFAYKVLELFAPNIVLGISDMLPPDGDIEKVRMVSEIVAEYKI